MNTNKFRFCVFLMAGLANLAIGLPARAELHEPWADYFGTSDYYGTSLLEECELKRPRAPQRSQIFGRKIVIHDDTRPKVLVVKRTLENYLRQAGFHLEDLNPEPLTDSDSRYYQVRWNWIRNQDN